MSGVKHIMRKEGISSKLQNPSEAIMTLLQGMAQNERVSDLEITEQMGSPEWRYPSLLFGCFLHGYDLLVYMHLYILRACLSYLVDSCIFPHCRLVQRFWSRENTAGKEI